MPQGAESSSLIVQFLEGQGSVATIVVCILIFVYLFYKEWSRTSLERTKINMKEQDSSMSLDESRGLKEVRNKLDKVVVDVARIEQTIKEKEKNDEKSFQRIDDDIRDMKRNVDSNFDKVFTILRELQRNGQD